MKELHVCSIYRKSGMEKTVRQWLEMRCPGAAAMGLIVPGDLTAVPQYPGVVPGQIWDNRDKNSDI